MRPKTAWKVYVEMERACPDRNSKYRREMPRAEFDTAAATYCDSEFSGLLVERWRDQVKAMRSEAFSEGLSNKYGYFRAEL
ncbi:hypothetical protein BD310DRAFT_937554 [Dichomitus squalens]|uniref:Uncharacterized protein n=1 Tax=Dichomitus squalens TaxID=114155 RepID=A0A4Q9PIJ4_9APHY|nr:hypothetical protein BD310DRAFT_937554 [Dichomitus squalens]